MDIVVKSSERSLDEHTCMFGCTPSDRGTKTYSTKRMRRHLAQHMQQLALFVLPRSIAGEGSEAGSMDSQRKRFDSEYSRAQFGTESSATSENSASGKEKIDAVARGDSAVYDDKNVMPGLRGIQRLKAEPILENFQKNANDAQSPSEAWSSTAEPKDYFQDLDRVAEEKAWEEEVLERKYIMDNLSPIFQENYATLRSSSGRSYGWADERDLDVEKSIPGKYILFPFRIRYDR
jgi:hypothetical protein